MNRVINTALVLLSVYVFLIRKYGVIPLMTGNIARHAAVGRAKWTAFWNTPVRDHRALVHSASDLIARLREERRRAASIAIGNTLAWYAIEHDKRYGLAA